MARMTSTERNTRAAERKIAQQRCRELQAQRAAVKDALKVLGDRAHLFGDTTNMIDAWNGLHDLDAAIGAELADLRNPAPAIPAHEQGTAALVARNID